MSAKSVRVARSLLLVALAALLAPAAAGARTDYSQVALSILPPGNREGADQLALYDGLTPLRGGVSEADVGRYFKPARFGTPRMTGRREATGRRGLTLIRDEYGVPHIFGARRSDVLFGAGWATAEDRGTLIEAMRGPARLTTLDVPGLGPIDSAGSLRRFVPSRQAERFLDAERRAIRARGRRGRRLIADAKDYVAGINAYYRKARQAVKPWTVNDVLAVASLFGAAFGRGGGDEVRSSQLLSALQQRLGASAGAGVWRDLRSLVDPEAPVTTERPFPYEPAPHGATPGSAIIDPGSLSRKAAEAAAVYASSRGAMGNAILVGRRRSATGHPLAVMGTQTGYPYSQSLMELDLHGGGIDARGAAFPGASLYVLFGRGKDYAWSATASGSDIVDQYLERLCNPDGSPPSRASSHYRFRGRCRPMRAVDAGILRGEGGDREVRFRQTVHGPVSGTATVGGRFYAVTSRRSTRGRDGMSWLAFAELNENGVRSARDFARVVNRVELASSWFYADDRDIAFYSSGRLPIRARGVDPSLPTLGTGQDEWQGFLPRFAHPQTVNPQGGLLLNWNNKPAAEFGASDANWGQGPVSRVDLLTGFQPLNRLDDLVSVMNRAATQDLRAVAVWPAVQSVLGSKAPDAGSRAAAKLVNDWEANGASRLDADLDGKVDAPGAAVLDAAWPRIADAVLAPVLGPQLAAFAAISGSDDAAGPRGSAYENGWYGYVVKDLRSLLGRSTVRGAYSRRYCGGGSIEACRAALWAAMRAAHDELAAKQGGDPAAWRSDAARERIALEPGPAGPRSTIRWTNRPTFQQVVEFAGHRPR